MGQVDLDLKPYLSDRRRYADVYNGCIFGGRQLVKAEELEPAGHGRDQIRQGRVVGTD